MTFHPLLPIVATLLVALAGCTTPPQPQHPGGAQGPAPGAGDVVQDRDLFRRTLQAQDYSREENYFPAFTSPRVALRGALDMREGSLWVYVMDGSARLWVFNRTFQAPALLALDFVSAPGEPGTWMVSLCFVGFTGSLSLEVTPAAEPGRDGDPWRAGQCPS